MTDIKPIETVYKGYRFRSRLEARWAVFFDALGIRWEYEAEGFALKSGRYLPDFWLPDLKAFVEIKPYGIDLQEPRNTLRELKDAACFPAILAVGVPGEYYLEIFGWDVGDSSGGSGEYLGLFGFYASWKWVKETTGATVKHWGGLESGIIIDAYDRSFYDGHWQPLSGWVSSSETMEWRDRGLGLGCGSQWIDAFNSLSRAIEKAKRARFEHGEVG